MLAARSLRDATAGGLRERTRYARREEVALVVIPLEPPSTTSPETSTPAGT